MIIAKFGGTSVASFERINALCSIIENQLDKKPIVVVSALSKVTDLLLSLLDQNSNRKTDKILAKLRQVHYELASNLFKKNQTLQDVLGYIDQRINIIKQLLETGISDSMLKDEVVANGEILSSYIIASAFNSKDIKAEQVIATRLITTNNNFGSADFLAKETQRSATTVLIPLITKGIVPVVTGFIGTTKGKRTTTLGRGGSDYTASILGYALKAKEVQIWTDVDGILTADPNIVKTPRFIKNISYREASELAAFGAKVLHPRTIKPAIAANIPVRVLNSFKPKNAGTLISDKPKSKQPITAISYKKKVTLINIYSAEMLMQRGFLARIFEVFAANNISIDLVSVSEVSISVTLDNDENLPAALKQLEKFGQVNVQKELGMVSLIGEGIVTSSNTIKRIFEELDKEKILVKMISLGATNINVSLVVQYDQVEHAVAVLHNKVLLSSMKGMAI